MDWVAIRLSLRLAFWTTALLLVIGTPLAYWLAFGRTTLRRLVEALVALPLVLPPTVLGFYILMATGPQSPLGRLYETLTGRRLPFSFQGLLVASIVYSLPFAVQPLVTAFRGVDRRLMEAAWCLGSGCLETFFRVVLPLSWPSVIAASALTFAHTIGEFGVVLMVGGNLPGVTRTVSIAIYDEVQALNYAAAGQTALVLLVFSFVVLTIVYSLRRDVWAVWPMKS
jgi:molybdate transport system permease protein